MPLPSISGPLGYKRTSHLLHRASFGPTKQQIDSFASLSANQAVSLLFQQPLPDPALPIDSVTGSEWVLSGTTDANSIANAPVRIVNITIGPKKMLLYGSNTKSTQIVLYGYDETNGELIGSRYLGFSNPFEIASIVPTSDGGLAIAGTTYVAGRFPRICIFKLSNDEVNKSFQ